MRTIRPLVALVAGALILGITPYAVAEPPDPPAKVKPAGPTVRWVTLVTGDRVMVRDEPGRSKQVVFTPTPGSGSTGAFTARVGGGHTLVIPSIAMRDVAAGRLDRALFDVTALLEDGYDDQHAKTLPVIVTYAGDRAGSRSRAAQDRPAGAVRSRVLSSIGARSVAIAKGSTRAFWASMTRADRVEAGVRTIYLDRRVKASIDRSVPQIGAPAAWQRGHTGKGVKVAVLDTGIDTGHPDLAGKVAAEANFSDSPGTEDRVGHGTHVAGTIAGSGSASDGTYRGVAPDAALLNGKVLDDSGFGSFSGIIAGMEWAAAEGAKVVNMSLGGGPTDGTDLLSVALNRISADTGALFVVAAGNCPHPQPEQVSTPAVADQALAVANLQRDGTANFSSCRGLRKGDFAVKPEIAAPGTGIVAARAAGTDPGDPVGEHYTTLTGTSMATPHVAGTAALLAQARPNLTGAQLRGRLISTADPQGDQDIADQGAGRVDADQATGDTLSVDQAKLDYGYLKWPHPNQPPITKTLTYRNSGSAPVTLDLTTAASGAAPALSTRQLVVPAGGQATVDVTADPAAAAFGSHTGRIVATPAGGGDPLVTLFGWYFENERHEVTIRGINRDGTAPNALVLVSRPDGKPFDGLDPEGTPMVDGAATVRVPPGVLDVSTFFWQNPTDTAQTALTLVNQPQVVVSAATTVTLDARTAKPAYLSAGGVPGLTPRYRVMRHYRTTVAGDPSALFTAWITQPGIRYFATPTEPVTVGSMEYRTGGRLEVPPYSARSLGDGGATIPVADLDWGPRFTGIRDLVAVDAGSGSPDELTGVRGKLAVIAHDAQSWPDEVVKAAQDAGAAAVLLFNPNQPGIDDVVGEFNQFGAHSIPVMRTSRAGATNLLNLIESRTVTVRVVGVQHTPLVYDLLAPTIGRVPADPGHVARPRNLATVTETFGAHQKGTLTVEDRTPLSTLEPPIVVSDVRVVPLLPAPFARVSYLSAGPIRWDQHVLRDGWNLTPTRSHQAGSRSRIAWFAPVANSGMPDSAGTQAGVQRVENWLRACFSPLDNGPDHEEFLSAADSTITIRRNGEPVGSGDFHCAFAETPADAADYEIELDARREDESWKYSTRVRSTWKFHADGSPDEKMPVILADLGVPTASLLNQVKVGRPATITLAARHQHGSTATPITSTRLEMSYDGQTWTELPLTPAGTNRYTATVTHPAGQAGGAVHLRLDIADRAGGRLTQEVTRAYGLTR